MRTVYLYITDTMADWEYGHIVAELNSRRFFKEDAPEVVLRTVGLSADPVRSMGGFTIVPDAVFDSINIDCGDVLILPGSDTWSDPKHAPVISFAKGHLSRGGIVCAICGATLALAFAGVLDDRKHTSNGPGFLEMFCPSYKGSQGYIDTPAVSDSGLITAGTTGGLEWAKLILSELDVFSEATLEAWGRFFSSGRNEDFFALMESVRKG